MKRRDQVVISRLRCTMAAHRYIINKQENNKCPFLWITFYGTPKSQRPKQLLGQGKRRNETTYRIRQKFGFDFLPRDIDHSIFGETIK
jgi:hypothetical protein